MANKELWMGNDSKDKEWTRVPLYNMHGDVYCVPNLQGRSKIWIDFDRDHGTDVGR